MLVNYTHRDTMRYNILVDDYLIRDCRSREGKRGPEAPKVTKKRKDETETYWDEERPHSQNKPCKVKILHRRRMRVSSVRP